MNYKKIFSLGLFCTALSTFCMEPDVDGQDWIMMETLESATQLIKNRTVALKKAGWERGCDTFLYRRDPNSPIYYAIIGKSGEITYCMNADYSTQNEPLAPSANLQGAKFALRALTKEEKTHLIQAKSAGKLLFPNLDGTKLFDLLNK